MLWIWWTKRVLFTMSCWNLTITGDRYRLQLIHLSHALREKRPKYEQRHDKVILLHDNARPHVAKVVKKYGNAQMGCFTVPAVFFGHCSFWLLVIPKDAASHRFTSFAEIENWLQNWIAFKDESFFRELPGIRKLSERWEKVVGSDNTLIDLFIHFVLK